MLEKTPESPPTARSNQSILRKLNLESSLKGLILNLNCSILFTWCEQYHWKSPWCWGKDYGRRRGSQRMKWVDGITNVMDMNLGNLGRWWGTGRCRVLQPMESQWVGHNWVILKKNLLAWVQVDDSKCYSFLMLFPMIPSPFLFPHHSCPLGETIAISYVNWDTTSLITGPATLLGLLTYFPHCNKFDSLHNINLLYCVSDENPKDVFWLSR